MGILKRIFNVDCRQRKRGRKPDKSDIYHLVPLLQEQAEEKGQPVKEASSVPFTLPKLSEVTITPAVVSKGPSKKPKANERSPSPEIIEIRKQKKVQVVNNPTVPDKKLETITPPCKFFMLSNVRDTKLNSFNF